MSRDLLILSNSVVYNLLISLSRCQILEIKHRLENALVDFSTSNEREYQATPHVVNRSSGQRTLFGAFTSRDAVGTKIIATPAQVVDDSGAVFNPPLRGLLSVCDSSGFPIGLINAEEVTAYQTALSALIPYMWRRHTEHVVIFGAGKQALWCCRLVLALRGNEIKTITIVNGSMARACSLAKQVGEENKRYWNSRASLAALDPSRADYDQCFNIILAAANAVFCTVGAKSPMFRLAHVLGSGSAKRRRAPFVSAIGSWQADMIELDPEVLRHAITHPGGGCKGGLGSILVDDRDECLANTWEFIQSGLGLEQVVEVGEILSWQRGKQKAQPSADDQARELWLSEGFVIYKSIGVGLTDPAIANSVLSAARASKAGIAIPDF